MVLPVKLVDLGGGVGQLREFGTSDKLPTSVFPAEFTISKESNPIINGGMEICQRGSSFAALTGYGLDRWELSKVGTAVLTVSQQGGASALSDSNYSQRLAVTTADFSIAVTDYCILSQKIEGFNVHYYIGKPFTISFWVRSSKTGIHCVALRNSGKDRSYVSEYMVNAVNTWEFKTVSVPAGLIYAGAWNWVNGTGLELIFTLAAGSNFHTSVGAWQTGNFLSTINQVNCLDTVNNTFAITDVCMNLGTLPIKMPRRLFNEKLADCQRYFCKTFDYAQAPVNNASGAGALACSIFGGVAGFYTSRWQFPVPMRDSPTITTYSPIGTTGNWVNSGATINSPPSVAQTTNSSTSIMVNSGSTYTPAGASVFYIHAAANAEL